MSSAYNYRTFVELLRQRAEYTPKHIIYTFLLNGEQKTAYLTYQELDRQSRSIAALLQSFHAEGERALLLYPPGLEFIAAFFGCLYAGVIAVPAYPPRNERHLSRIQTIVADAQAKFVLTIRKTQEKITSWLAQYAAIASLKIIETDQIAVEEHAWREPDINGDSLAFLQYTSGSTALPKGVMVSHANLLYNSAMICERFGNSHESRAVIWLPPYHDMGLIGGILQPLYVGFPVVLMSPAAFLQRPLRWLEAISTYRATTSGGPNFAYDLCVEKTTPEQRQLLDLRSWELAFSGAEPVHPGTLERFTAAFTSCGFRREAFYPCYGLAEATLFVSGGQKSKLPILEHFQTTAIEERKILAACADDDKVQTLVGVGNTLSEQRIVIVNPTLRAQCAADEIGEVWVSGPGIAEGYWNRDEATRETFQAYLKGTGEGPFLRTGDLGFLQDEELFITGRLKDLIIIRGRNHYPQDIEWTVENCHEAIRRNCSAAFSLHVDDEERLVIVAEIERRYHRPFQSPKEAIPDQEEHHFRRDRRQPEVLDPGFTPDIKHSLDLEKTFIHIRQTIAENHDLQVEHIVLIKFGTIPRTSSGKIQRHACKAAFLEKSLEVIAAWHLAEGRDARPEVLTKESHAMLSGAWETFLAFLWADALHIDAAEFHSHSHFFQLGGDSLNAITLTGTLADKLGRELDTDLLYQYPTLQELAAYLEQKFGTPPSEKQKFGLLPQYQQFCHPEIPDYPLLPLQQSFLIGRTLGDVAIYMMLDLELHGDLNLKLFQQAIYLLNARHPALRTAFTIKATGLSQHIMAPEHQQNVIEQHSLAHLSQEERVDRLNQEMLSLVQHPFNNLSGETFRAKIFTMNSHTYRLFINFDHLAIDGFSLSKWFEDLHRVYGQLLQAQIVADTPQTSLNFKDYVEIFTTLQGPEQRTQDMTYWLKTIPAYEVFPAIGEPEQLENQQRFGVHTQVLGMQLVRELHKHAQAHKLTFFSILMASFFKLLALWTNSQTLTINTPHLNRRPYALDIQEVLGCFTDILPIRCEQLLEQDLQSLARTIHQALAEMHHHSSVSGVEIARAVAQKQHTTPKALSPIIFSSALFPLESMGSPDTYTISSVRVRTGAPETFIDVIVYEACGEFVCSWNYLQSQFSAEKIRSLAEQYASILQEFAQHPQQADPLQTLLTYPDFAAWYQKQQQQAEQKRHQEYWKKQLQTMPILQIQLDQPQGKESLMSKKASKKFKIPAHLHKKLRSFSKKWNSSMSTTLLTAFQTLLYRYTNQDDIAVGTIFSEADFSERMFIVRTDLSENPSFAELLKRVQDRYLEARIHQDVSLDEVLEALHTSEEARTAPAVQVVFAYQSPTYPDQWTLALSTYEEQNSVAHCDLLLSLDDTKQGLFGEWHYAAGLFAKRTIETITGHFLKLLQEIVAYPEKSIFQLNILTDAERHQIIEEWNATAVDYPLDTCIHELVEAQARRTPNATALIFEEQQLTYHELNAKANQLAHYLRKFGVGSEVLVGISVERSFEMVIGLLGILKAGGAYIPMDPEYPPERLAFMLEDSQVPVLLTQEKLLAVLPAHRSQVICLDRDWPLIDQEPETTPHSGVTSENLIYAIYTSGSTGKPKGALNLHRSIVNRILWMQDAYHLTPEDRVLQKTPFSFDVSGWEFWWPLLTGAQMVIAKPGGHKDSAYLVNLIQTQQITTMHFVPPMLQVFLEERGVEQCASLRRVICSGEALPYELQERFFEKFTTCELHNLYGPTEAAIDVTYWQCQPNDSRRLVPIGRPIANTQIYILDPYLQPVPVGIPGELHIGGVNLARGYLNRPELTQEKFISNPFSDDLTSRLYKTGDLVRFLSDGNIEYLGRFDHQIKIRGFRIELGEIEATLDSHPAVRESVVLAKEDLNGDKRLIAYLVTAQQPAPDTSVLREFLKEKLPDYMVPAIFIALDEFPLTPNGKVNRRALPEPEQRTQSSAAFVSPQNELERQIADVWHEMLHLDTIGIHDNFFELGGHSLLAIQMHSKLQELLDMDISVVEVFQYPTIHAMAQYVSQKQQKSEAEPEQARGEKRMARRAAVSERRQRRQQHRKTTGIQNKQE
ncbi:amino acid adenylation domain protein [Candidatus Vecturithrix granuli]|uniref:Amino acid adenylation domain protein n=1 Tax=Vecturithrix granuli TaxID=1499967 RepID=A0A081BVS3_VECG1|nr:amino acid adenylation domain protein [Candidatus Vecturithrix granuli]